MFEVGSVVGKKYRILSEIGQGGMSTVYLVVNEKTNKLWAMKKIRKTETRDNKLLKESLETEIYTLKKLKHPNLPSVVEVIEQQDEYLVIMDYIEGISLENLLAEQEVLDEEQVVRYAIQLCDVLGYLHTRKPPIIYRDMKPSNIVLKPDGTIVLIDFGTAREFKENAAGDTNNLGTRGYAAPEQFGKKGQTDARTDIFCLGMTLYQLLTADNPTEVPYGLGQNGGRNSKLSMELGKIINKCIQKNPSDRFQSADELMQALLHYREYGLNRKKKYKKRLRLAGGMMLLSVLSIAAAVYLQDKTVVLPIIEQSIPLSEILFVTTVLFAIAAILLFFVYDNKKRYRKRKKNKVQVPPPVTIELTPRAIYPVDETELMTWENNVDWEILQDITYVHAKGILDEGMNQTMKIE